MRPPRGASAGRPIRRVPPLFDNLILASLRPSKKEGIVAPCVRSPPRRWPLSRPARASVRLLRPHLCGAMDASASRFGAPLKKETRTGLCAAASPQPKALQMVSLMVLRAEMPAGVLPVLSTRRPFFERFFGGLLTANPLCPLMFLLSVRAVAAVGWSHPVCRPKCGGCGLWCQLAACNSRRLPAPWAALGRAIAKDFASRNSRDACGR